MPFIESIANLKPLVEEKKQEGKMIVTTNGCFDILHLGHIQYLEEAKALGDILIVGINSDQSVKMIKGKGRPINPEKDRAKVLASLRCVDYTFIFNEPDPRTFLKVLKPQIHAKGGDYTVERMIERETVESYGGRIALLSLVKGRSTTRLINQMSRNCSCVEKS
jgi:glycerol-3-phosphate cytidylyltransferase